MKLTWVQMTTDIVWTSAAMVVGEKQGKKLEKKKSIVAWHTYM